MGSIHLIMSVATCPRFAYITNSPCRLLLAAPIQLGVGGGSHGKERRTCGRGVRNEGEGSIPLMASHRVPGITSVGSFVSFHVCVASFDTKMCP